MRISDWSSDVCSSDLRAFFDPATWPARPGDPNKAVGSISLFSGRVANVEEVGRSAAMVKVKSDLSLLSVDMPRNVYQASCLNTLFDPICKLNINLFRINAEVTGASTRRPRSEERRVGKEWVSRCRYRG